MYYFFGMNLLWWIFWALAIVVFWALLTPVPRSRVRPLDPIEILRRRYAAGEITTAEFDERVARLTSTAPVGTRRAAGAIDDLPPTPRPPSESTAHH